MHHHPSLADAETHIQETQESLRDILLWTLLPGISLLLHSKILQDIITCFASTSMVLVVDLMVC